MGKNFDVLEIVENKVELRRLNPNAESLEYISVCEHPENGQLVVRFNLGDEFSRESFGKYVGVEMNGNIDLDKSLGKYNEALKKEIEEYRGAPVTNNNGLYFVDKSLIDLAERLKEKRAKSL